MPRRARSVFPGIAHHVTQRGNNRQQVFLAASDYERYLKFLATNCGRSGVVISAYCLMPNHIHLIAVPESENSLSKALGRTHAEYALAFNRSEGRSGHLWQNRFFSCPLDREHLRQALLYVELNPVRAGMVDEEWQWPWSSARVPVLRGGFGAGRDGSNVWDGAAAGWKGELEPGLSDEDAERIRRATRVGEPLGSKTFIMELERQVGRRLRVREQGRPRKIGGDGGVQEDMFSE